MQTCEIGPNVFIFSLGNNIYYYNKLVMSSTQKIYLLRNADSKVPQSTDIEYGEIAIGYKANAESLFIKNTADNIVRFLPSTALMSSVTYSELVNLRSQNALIPSIYYRITDFVTVVNDNTYYKSAGH